MSETKGEELFARVVTAAGETVGYAYAVTLLSGQVRRRHDREPLEGVLARLVDARSKDGWLLFSGAAWQLPDDHVETEGDDGEEADVPPPAATAAGAVRADQVAELGYWSPEEERPGREALEAATAVCFALYQGGSQVAGSIAAQAQDALGGLMGGGLLGGNGAPSAKAPPAPAKAASSPPARGGLKAL